MKKLSLGMISFLQAAGIITYVILFAFTVQTLAHRYPDSSIGPFFSMALVLMLFVFSAALCSTLFLGYPAQLFFDGKKKEAVRLILGNIAWLAVFLIVFLALIFVIAV